MTSALALTPTTPVRPEHGGEDHILLGHCPGAGESRTKIEVDPEVQPPAHVFAFQQAAVVRDKCCRAVAPGWHRQIVHVAVQGAKDARCLAVGGVKFYRCLVRRPVVQQLDARGVVRRHKVSSHGGPQVIEGQGPRAVDGVREFAQSFRDVVPEVKIRLVKLLVPLPQAVLGTGKVAPAGVCVVVARTGRLCNPHRDFPGEISHPRKDRDIGMIPPSAPGCRVQHRKIAQVCELTPLPLHRWHVPPAWIWNNGDTVPISDACVGR